MSLLIICAHCFLIASFSIPVPTPELATEQPPRNIDSQQEVANTSLPPELPAVSDTITLASGGEEVDVPRSYNIHHLVREVEILRARMDAAGLDVVLEGLSPPAYRSDLSEE